MRSRNIIIYKIFAYTTLILLFLFSYISPSQLNSLTLDDLLSSSIDYSSQDKFSGEEKIYSDIFITPIKISNFPGDVIIYEGYEINESGYLSIADFIKDIAGSYLRGLPGGEYNVYTSGENSILILIDGIPQIQLTEISPDLTLIPLENIKRLEIYQGPISSLYPSTTHSNIAVNIITTPEKTETPRSFIFLSDGYADLERYKFQYQMSVDPVDFSISGNRLFYTGFDYLRDLSRGAFTGTASTVFGPLKLPATFIWSSGEYYEEGSYSRINDKVVSFNISPQITINDGLHFLMSYKYKKNQLKTKNNQSNTLRFGIKTRSSGLLDMWVGGFICKTNDKIQWGTDTSMNIVYSDRISSLTNINFIKNNANYNLNLTNGITFSLSKNFYLYFSNRLNFSENLRDLSEKYYEVGIKFYKNNLLETTIYYENFQSDKTQTKNNSIGGRVFIDTPFLFHSRLTGFIRDGIYSIYPKRKLECKFGIDKHFKKQNLNFSADLIYHYLGGIHYEPSKFLDPSLPQNENLKHSHSFDFEGRLSISSLNLFFIYENLFNNQILIQNQYFPQKPRSIKWGIMWSFIN